MVNQVEMADIPLAGRGFAHRPVGNFQPGEYKRLVNMVFTNDGTLRKRPPVELGFDGDPVENVGEFIGHLEEWVVFALNDGTDALKFCKRDGSGTNVNDIWVGDDLYVEDFDPDTEGHKIVGFFRYNNRNYWISISNNYTGTTDTYKFYLHSFTAGTAEDVTVLPLVFQHDIPQDQSLLFTVAVDNHGMFGVAPFAYKKFFWHKDRLWIVTNRGVFFSKATDPTNFTAPDGGFFKFPDDLVKDALAHHDKIYIMGNDNLQYVTYVSDPNTDASVVSITTGVGGDALALHDDSVYLLRLDQLYLVEPNRVSKVFDLDLGIGTNADLQLTTYFDYIIICARTLGSTFDVGIEPLVKTPVWGETGEVVAEQSGNVPYYCNNFFLDMKNGVVTEFVYHENTLGDFEVGEHHTTLSGPISWYLVPFETDVFSGNSYYLWFQTSGTDVNLGRVFSLRDIAKDYKSQDKGYEFAWDALDAQDWQSIPVLVEIDSYTPDGSEIWVKKFRSLGLEGEFPVALNDTASLSPTIAFAYDNQAYGTALDINSDLGFNDEANTRLPVPIRVPLNQRARSVSIRIHHELLDSSLDLPAANEILRFELTRATMFWTPTARGPIDRKGE